MVRQAQVDRGDPQGGDDQRGLRRCSTPTPHNKASDADAALAGARRPTRIGQAYVTATVTVWDDDPRVADEKLRLVEKVIQGRDFTCMAETRQRGRGLARHRCPAMSTPMSASRRSRRSTSPT